METRSDTPQLVDVSDACKLLFGSDEHKFRQRLLRDCRLGRIRTTRIGNMYYLPQDEVERLASGK